MKNKNKNITKIVNKYKTDQDVDVSKVSSPLRPERNLNQAGLVSSRLPIVEEKTGVQIDQGGHRIGKYYYV